MKKQIKTLIQMGVVYLAVSIVLDFFLAGYPILTWTGLGFAFILFGIIVFNVLLELTSRPAPNKSIRQFKRSEDDLMRLDTLCQRAIDHGDTTSTQLLSERIRSLAFAAASYHFNINEPLLRNMAQQDPTSLERQINDQRMFEALTATSSGVSKRNTHDIHNCLTSIEAWLS
ncbi:MAG: hypothetical protein ABSD99_02930 [Candidatus Bathyarchaeia archaeon]|jgi:hypothetical protein